MTSPRRYATSSTQSSGTAHLVQLFTVVGVYDCVVVGVELDLITVLVGRLLHREGVAAVSAGAAVDRAGHETADVERLSVVVVEAVAGAVRVEGLGATSIRSVPGAGECRRAISRSVERLNEPEYDSDGDGGDDEQGDDGSRWTGPGPC